MRPIPGFGDSRPPVDPRARRGVLESRPIQIVNVSLGKSLRRDSPSGRWSRTRGNGRYGLRGRCRRSIAGKHRAVSSILHSPPRVRVKRTKCSNLFEHVPKCHRVPASPAMPGLSPRLPECSDFHNYCRRYSGRGRFANDDLGRFAGRGETPPRISHEDARRCLGALPTSSWAVQGLCDPITCPRLREKEPRSSHLMRHCEERLIPSRTHPRSPCPPAPPSAASSPSSTKAASASKPIGRVA